jgi:hypothetical protein
LFLTPSKSKIDAMNHFGKLTGYMAAEITEPITLNLWAITNKTYSIYAGDSI